MHRKTKIHKKTNLNIQKKNTQKKTFDKDKNQIKYARNKTKYTEKQKIYAANRLFFSVRLD